MKILNKIGRVFKKIGLFFASLPKIGVQIIQGFLILLGLGLLYLAYKMDKYGGLSEHLSFDFLNVKKK